MKNLFSGNHVITVKEQPAFKKEHEIAEERYCFQQQKTNLNSLESNFLVYMHILK